MRRSECTKTKGFSLLELVISIAIIGVLFALVLPIYKGYVEQAKLTASLALMSYHRQHTAAFYSIHGRMPGESFEYLYLIPPPNDEDAEGYLQTNDAYTNELISENSVLTAITPERKVDGKRFKLSLQPALWRANRDDPRVILWLCGNKSAPAGSLVIGENKTDVPKRLLPPICKN